MTPNSRRLWLARGLVGAVLVMNGQAALAFLLAPQNYAPGFELSGQASAVIVRAMGLLFLMWNVPYAFAAWHPLQNRVSLWEAVAMQLIGWVGEALIWGTLPAGHLALRATVARFIVFDGAGLAALLAAVRVVYRLSG